MGLKLLYRYILKGVLKSFSGLLLLFSIIIVSSQFMHLPSVVYFMSFNEFLKLIFFINFSFFKYQMLFAFLIASTVFGYSLRERREIYAIYALGISLKQILKPVWILSIFVSFFSLLISLFVVPYANRERANFITVSVKQYFMESIHEKNFSNISKGIVIYADKKKDNTISHLFIHMQNNGWTITAKKAQFLGNRLVLNNGFIQIPGKEGFNLLMFKEYDFDINIDYIKKYSLEDYENSKLIKIIKENQKNKYKALAILTERFSFFIPFLFIGVIGFLISVNTFLGKELALSISILISIGYLLIDFLSIKLISNGSIPFFSLPLILIVYFYSIYFFIKKERPA